MDIAASRDDFRAGMRRVAGAVTIVTTADAAGERRGATATAVCSLTVDPPAVIACIARDTAVGRMAPESGIFTVNVLTQGQRPVAETFAGRTGHVGGERFAVGDWTAGALGAPRLAGAVAAFECRLEKAVEFATHVVLFGAVVGTVLGPTGLAPLVYVDGRFAGVPNVDAGSGQPDSPRG